MFSTSMIASSTTTPMATTSPASTMTLRVAPAASRTSMAATSESGMAIRLMKAVRHSKRNATMINTTRAMPSRSATVRLSIDCSMNVAGRKIVVSTSMPRQSRRHLGHRLLDAARDLHRVGAAELLHHQQQPGPSLTTASPISGPGSTSTRPRSASRTILPSRSSTGTWPSSSGPVIGWTWRML